MLQNIIPSKARRKILQLFFHHPQEHYYLRHIVREVHEEVNAVKRELDILSEAKVLLKEKRLNKIFYSLNKNYLFYDEFLRIFAKMGVLNNLLQKNLSKIGKVKFAVMSRDLARDLPLKKDEIYVLYVGHIVLPEVESIMQKVDKELDREINYTVMTEEELQFRKKNNDPFIWRFLKQPKIMLIGAEEELVK